MDEIQWFPMSVRCPYIKKLIKHDQNKIIFNGYFYLEDKTLPVKRILYQNQMLILVEIISKKTLEDTSIYGEYDKDLGGRISFYPTNIIELEYKIIKEIDHSNEYETIRKNIEGLEIEIIEKDNMLRNLREEEELKIKSEEWKNLDYKKFLKDMNRDKHLDDI